MFILAGALKHLDDSEPGQPFCVGVYCGKRVDRKRQLQVENRSVSIEIQKVNNYYALLATIENPPADAERNAPIIEKIIASFRFSP